MRTELSAADDRAEGVGARGDKAWARLTTRAGAAGGTHLDVECAGGEVLDLRRVQLVREEGRDASS